MKICITGILPLIENLSQIPQIIAEFNFLRFQRNLRETKRLFFHFVRIWHKSGLSKMKMMDSLNIPFLYLHEYLMCH